MFTNLEFSNRSCLVHKYEDGERFLVAVRELKVKHNQKLERETVLVMQGGGSLGAYECGVYKALVRHGIKFDIVTGTSIGAINAGIIPGSKTGKTESDLENFWLEVAETATPSILPDSVRSIASSSYSGLYGNSKAFAPVRFDYWQSAKAGIVPPWRFNYL